jgi:DNA-directed RNA polymerase subunit RPC12/RpoP
MTWREIAAAIKRRKTEIEKWHRRLIDRWQRRTMAEGNCRACGKPRAINPKTGKLFYYCPPCHSKYLFRMKAYMRKRYAKKALP